MRMWGIPPELMCRKHLLGEHVEMHMFIGAIKKGKSVQGFLDKKLINPREVVNRHNELVVEMLRRGMNHKSPLGYDCSQLPEVELDIRENIFDLMNRCEMCRTRMEGTTIDEEGEVSIDY